MPPKQTAANAMKALTHFCPSTGAMDQWNEAYKRVDQYLWAHRLTSLPHRSAWVMDILRQTAQTHQTCPDRSVTPLAMEHADRVIKEWMGNLFKSFAWNEEVAFVQARVACFLSEGVMSESSFFFNKHTSSFPLGWVQNLDGVNMQTGPGFAFSSMVARPLELGGLPHIAGHAFAALERRRVLKLIVGWMILTLLFILSFWMTR